MVLRALIRLPSRFEAVFWLDTGAEMELEELLEDGPVLLPLLPLRLVADLNAGAAPPA